MRTPTRLTRSVRAAVGLTLLTHLLALPVGAATNQATGDVAGDPAALTDSNVFVLNSTGSELALVKRAFLEDGTPVADASTVSSGTVLKFMIYINNPSSVQIQDVSVRDVLDPAFLYQTGTIKVDNTVGECAAQICNAGEEDTLFTAVDDNTPLDDAVDADVASYTVATTTIDGGDENVANAQLNIAGDSVWVMLFTVKMP